MAKSPEEILDACRKECARCQEDYRKSGCDFSPSTCSHCPTGREAHEAEMQLSKGEQAWGKIDWNHHRYKDFYKG